MEQDVLSQFEGICALVGRHAPGFGEIAHHLRIVGGVEFEQGGVVRDYRVDKDKGEVGVTIVVWRFGIDREIKSPATSWVRVCCGGAMENEHTGEAYEECPPVARGGGSRPGDRHGEVLIRHRNFLRTRSPAFTGSDPFANADIVGRGLAFPAGSLAYRRSIVGARLQSARTSTAIPPDSAPWSPAGCVATTARQVGNAASQKSRLRG